MKADAKANEPNKTPSPKRKAKAKPQLTLQEILIQLGADAVSMAVAKLVAAPLERVKIIMQVGGTASVLRLTPSLRLAPVRTIFAYTQLTHPQVQLVHPLITSGEVAPFSSFVDCLNRLVADEGIESLWRGTGLPRPFGNLISFALKNSFKVRALVEVPVRRRWRSWGDDCWNQVTPRGIIRLSDLWEERSLSPCYGGVCGSSSVAALVPQV
jgi:hypothetical protein